jgi:pantoate--beta-alanine ligase
MSVSVLRTVREVREALSPLRGAGIGFVPTMGALHRGHFSLIEQCARQNETTVVSIFVNPIQFDSAGDLHSYPRTFDADKVLCEEAGADFIFVPGVSEIYPDGFSTFVDTSEGADQLCGAARPGHFRGVLTVVNKLFNIVQPAVAYFGEKDAQQIFLIRKMVRDLGMPVLVVGCPTVRDSDMVAVSSRNARLSARERGAAACLHRALTRAVAAAPDIDKIREIMVETIAAEPLATLDYAEVLDADTLKPATQGTKNILLAVAAILGETRLIDNMTFRRYSHE